MMMQNHQDMKSNNKFIKIEKFFKKLPKQINIELRKYRRFHVTNKKKNIFDPVTNIDKNIEKFIRKKIVNVFPNHKIIGEEIKNRKSKSDYTWYIDPIDGTKNLILGVPLWSNLIGLFYKDKSIISLANFPMLKTFYLAYGGKTFKFENNKKKILLSNKKIRKKINITLNTLRPFENSKIRKIQKTHKGIFKISGIDALNFCLVAEGKIDILIEKGLKQVDFFPLISIIENSGAIISDWQGKKRFNDGDVLVSGNKKNHLKFLKFLKK